MIDVLKFAIVCYGATTIIVYGMIFNKWREKFYKTLREPWNRFFFCPMCVGFWVGVLCHALGLDAFGNVFWAGCAASGICYFFSGFYESMFRKKCGGCR